MPAWSDGWRHAPPTGRTSSRSTTRWSTTPIVLRTTPYSLLGSQASGTVLALEVDQFDYEYHRGWSVVARGRAKVVVDAAELEHIRETWNPAAWAAGGRTLYLRLRWTELTGRRLGQGWDPMSSLPVHRSV